MGTINTSIQVQHKDTGMAFSFSAIRSSDKPGFSVSEITVGTTDEVVSSEYPTPRNIMLRLLSGDDVRVGLDGSTYPFRLAEANDAMILRLDVEGIREVSTVVCTADTASSLSGDYFDIEDRVDTVRIWYNMAATKSFGTLTLSGNAANNETVVLGATTYTFKATLTPSANEVLIGAAATNSIDNLIAAITAGSGSGTLYGAGTVVNASATAAVGAGDTMTATALIAGTAGNTIASTETLGSGSWGAATLTGGTAASTSPATPSGGRLLPVVIVEDATASAVALATQLAIDADAEFSAGVSTATVTITDSHTGTRSIILAGTTGFAVATTQEGVASPAVHLKSIGTSQVVVGVIPN